MEGREIIDWVGSIAITVGIVGLTVIGVMFLVFLGSLLTSCIFDVLGECREGFEKLK